MMKYQDKYRLTPEQSAFLAKKKWDENVYCGMRMENRAVTFPQTRTILNGVNVPNVQLDDIQAILNMRDAWKYLMNSMDVPLTVEYICKLNEFQCSVLLIPYLCSISIHRIFYTLFAYNSARYEVKILYVLFASATHTLLP